MNGRFTAQDIDSILAFSDAHRGAALARLTASLAHKLGTPLQVIQGRLFLMQDGASEAVQAQAEAIAEECAKLSKLLSDALGFVRLPSGEVKRRDLVELVREAAADLDVWCRRHGAVLRIGIGPGLELDVDEAQFRQALVELVALVLPGVRDGTELLVQGEIVPASEVGLPGRGRVAVLSLSWEGEPLAGTAATLRAEPWFAQDASDETKRAGLDWMALSELTRHRGAKIEPNGNECRVLWPEESI